MQRVRFYSSTVGGIVKKVAFFDLFSGCGGAAEGALQAGAVVPLSVDCWDDANAVHQDNHPHTTVVNIELGTDPDYEVRLLKGQFRLWRSRGYHIHLHGSPPCQALSQANTKGNREDGMKLVNHYLWLVKQSKPDSWSMEQVKNVRKYLPDGIDHVMIQAADFGVPQTRVRCYAGEGWTATTTHHRWEWVSVLDALPHLKDELQGYAVPKSMSKGRWRESISPSEPYPTITRYSPLQLQLKLEATGGNANRKSDSCLTVPSKTICGGGNQVGPRIFNHSEKPFKVRSLTIEETATLQSFPSTYSFEKGRLQKSRWTMIGNAVPPLVMKAILEGIQ